MFRNVRIIKNLSLHVRQLGISVIKNAKQDCEFVIPADVNKKNMKNHVRELNKFNGMLKNNRKHAENK